MSFADHAVLWLHVTAAVFTIGPGTAAIMSTPRFIRRQNAAVVGYLYRTTRIYSFAALLTLIFGLVLATLEHKFSQWWISVSLTLFIVAFVLLVLILRDQRKAVKALVQAEQTQAEQAQAGTGEETAVGTGEETVRSVQQELEPAEAEATDDAQPAPTPAPTPVPTREADLKLAAVERGRIASMGGITALIWLVILVLMVWQ